MASILHRPRALALFPRTSRWNAACGDGASLKTSCEEVAKLVAFAREKGPEGNSDVSVRKCIESCVEVGHRLDGRDLGELAYGLAKLRCRDTKVWAQTASAVTQKVHQINPSDLKQIAGSFSVATLRHKEMLNAMSCRLKESPNSLGCWGWADFIFSLQRAGIQDAELLAVAAAAMLTDTNALKKLKQHFIMAFIDASLSAGVVNHKVYRVVSVLAGVLATHMQSLNPQDLARVTLACGKASCKDQTDQTLLRSLRQAIRHSILSFPQDRISYTIHGLSLMGCKDKGLMAELAFAWVGGEAGSHPEGPREATWIIYALMKSGVSDALLFDHIATHSLQFVPHFDARSIAEILFAYSQIGCPQVEFLESLANAATQKVSEFSVIDLCSVATAGARLSLSPILGNIIPEAAVERMSEFQGANLALMMRAVSRLSDTPGKFMPVLEKAALQNTSTLSCVDLRNIAMAWAKTHVADGDLVNALALRTIELSDGLVASDISNIAWAYSLLQVRNADLFAVLGVRISQTVSSFTTRQLGHTASAFVQARFHNEIPLVSIAEEASRRLGNMDPLSAALFVRAFLQADLHSPAVAMLLEELATFARQKGWVQLRDTTIVEFTDFQKQCVETVRETIPSIKVNQRHQMGPLLNMALLEMDGTIVNLEVDADDPIPLNVARNARRDDFLEILGVEVLRIKVKSQDDLRYHMQEMFGKMTSSEQTIFEPEVDVSEGPTLCENLWREIEPAIVHSRSSL